jgi:hypothetical protein
LGIFLNSAKMIILLFLCCSSCASSAPAKEDRLYIYLAGSSKYFLLPAGDIENSLDMAQRISAEWQGKDYTFNAWVIADKAGIELTLLNELGVSMGELSCRNGLVSFSSSIFPKSLKPEYIIADFQLCFYNTAALRKAVESCGLSFETSGDSRRIFQGKTVIIEIEKRPDTVRLVNHLRGYAYTLEGDFE